MALRHDVTNRINGDIVRSIPFFVERDADEAMMEGKSKSKSKSEREDGSGRSREKDGGVSYEEPQSSIADVLDSLFCVLPLICRRIKEPPLLVPLVIVASMLASTR